MRMRSLTGLCIVTFIMAAALALFAQEGEVKKIKPEKKDNPPQTLFRGKSINLSGYGAPVYKFSPAGETYSHFVGGRGGLIINDIFVIGGGGYGLVYPDRRDKLSGETYTGTEPYVHMGYGGGLLELHIYPKSLIHLSAGVLIGAGGITFDSSKPEDSDDNQRHGDSFFVAEPELNLYVNVTRFLRIGIGASYRFVNGINSDELSDSDFRGPTAQVMFAFGWF
jgi:hypothetical protein